MANNLCVTGPGSSQQIFNADCLWCLWVLHGNGTNDISFLLCNDTCGQNFNPVNQKMRRLLPLTDEREGIILIHQNARCDVPSQWSFITGMRGSTKHSLIRLTYISNYLSLAFEVFADYQCFATASEVNYKIWAIILYVDFGLDSRIFRLVAFRKPPHASAESHRYRYN